MLMPEELATIQVRLRRERDRISEGIPRHIAEHFTADDQPNRRRFLQEQVTLAVLNAVVAERMKVAAYFRHVSDTWKGSAELSTDGKAAEAARLIAEVLDTAADEIEKGRTE